MYFCDYNLPNCIKCKKRKEERMKSRPNFSSALLASSTASLFSFLSISERAVLLINFPVELSAELV